MVKERSAIDTLHLLGGSAWHLASVMQYELSLSTLRIDVMLNLQVLPLCHCIVKAGDSKVCGSLTYQNTFGLLLQDPLHVIA